MLKKVRITNFLSCQDTEIEFDNITALIGRNAAGKTNILKAIEYCAQFAIGKLSNDFIYTENTFFNGINIEFSIENKIYQYKRLSRSEEESGFIFIEQLLHKNNKKWNLIAERKNEKVIYYNAEITEFNINAFAPMISSISALLPQKVITPDIKIILNHLSEVKYYTLDEDKSEEDKSKNGYYLISDNFYKKWISSNEEKSSILMRLLHIWKSDKELFKELLSLLGENSLNLIEGINITKSYMPQIQSDSESFYMIRFRTKNIDVNYNQLSYGTQRVLAILLALLYDKNSTLLIEQPEDGIHSGLLKKLLPICFQYAKHYNKQLIIATHSSEVINLFKPENIRLVKMTENGTKVFPLDKERMPFIRDYIENEGALFDLIEAMDDE